jgi:hypothetical protein
MYLIATFSALIVVFPVLGWDYYPSSYNWSFQNYCYLGFGKGINFTNAPNRGVSYDSSLVGYWSMNEGSGTVTSDGSGNSNNGTIANATWATGKFGSALNFMAGSSILIASTAALNISDYITLSAWIYPRSAGQNDAGRIISKRDPADYGLALGSGASVNFVTNGRFYAGSGPTALNEWHHVVATFDKDLSSNQIKIYVDGILKGQGTLPSITSTQGQVYIGNRGDNIVAFDGVIDDVRIYSRALSASEVTALYALPDPVSLKNYYSFEDPDTNSTVTVNVDSSNTSINNIALVTCTNFFAEKRLTFEANNSATVSVWTNLGQPIFTTGVWNSQNFTTTLMLDASSTAELNWNTYNITTCSDAHSTVSPSNVTVAYGGSQTFKFNASEGYSFDVTVDGAHQGQISSYIFNDVTAPHTISVTSTQLTYTITASADAHSTITPGNVSVTYGGNQLFHMTAESGYYISHVHVDGEDQGNITSYNFTNVQSNHTISVSSATIAPTNGSTPTPSPTPSPSTSPTSSPTPSQTPQPTNSPFPTEAALIAVVAIVIIVALFALALKKGYITIEVVKESPED